MSLFEFSLWLAPVCVAITFAIAWRLRSPWWGYVGAFIGAAILWDLTLRLIAWLFDA